MNKKGFTLVELLAIIVILGILLTLGIPQVLNAINVSKKKSFLEYIDKVAVTAQTVYQEKIESNDDLESKSTIFDITKDLGLSNTGSFKGYVLVTYDGDTYVTLYNDTYAIANYKYNSDTNKEEDLKTISEVNTSTLTTENLAKAGHTSSFYYYNNNIITSKKIDNTKAVLLDGPKLNLQIKKFVDPTVTSNTAYISGIRHIVYTQNLNSALSNKVKVSDTSKSTEDIYMWYDESTGTVTIGCANEKIYLHPNSNYLFSALADLTDVDLSHFDTSEVIYFSRMFQNSKNIQALDVSHFVTKNGTNFRAMFQNLTYITELDTSNWDTSNATDYSYLFQGCGKLSKMDTTVFNSKRVSNTETMFQYTAFTELDLRNMSTKNVTNMFKMFNKCKSLTKILVSDEFVFDKVTNSTDMFTECYKLPGYNSSQTTHLYASKYLTYS